VKHCRFLLLFFLLGFIAPLSAQKSDSEKNASEKVVENEQQTKDQKSQTEEKIKLESTSSKSGRFVPSEEVSEDLSISFPADI
jgi:hypothetical protein